MCHTRNAGGITRCGWRRAFQKLALFSAKLVGPPIIVNTNSYYHVAA